MVNIKCNFYSKDGKHKGFYSFDGNTSVKDVDIVNKCKTFDPNVGEYFIQVSSGTTYFIIIPYETEIVKQTKFYSYFVSFSHKIDGVIRFSNIYYNTSEKIVNSEGVFKILAYISERDYYNIAILNFQLLEA